MRGRPSLVDPCPACGGAGCPRCFGTGKRRFEIGEEVVWDNQEGSLAPPSVLERHKKYLGHTYRVTALMEVPDDPDRYYVGIDVKLEPSLDGSQGLLVFDTNLLRLPKDGDEESDTETATGPSDADLVGRLCAHPPGGSLPSPRWSLVGNAFSVGSGTARRLCERFGLNPDEMLGDKVRADGE